MLWWRESQPEGIWPAYESFPVFLGVAWDHLKLPKPTPVQVDIARYLQASFQGERDRAVIEAFRGIGKSWITAAFVCWLLLRDPQLNIMVVSASKDRSDNFSTFCLRVIEEMPLLAHLYPKPGQRCSKVAFDVAPALADHAPSVRSVGVFGQMTGGRADIVIADDVEVPNTADTVGMREKLSTRVKEFSSILKPGGTIIYLGTPQTEESLYNALPERGFDIRVWPARVPEQKLVASYGDRLAAMVRQMVTEGRSGEPTDPLRFDNEDLLKREYDYGRAGFALQFMLDTTLSDADRYPLKLSDLAVMDVHQEMAPERIYHAKDSRLAIDDLPLVGFAGDRFYAPMEYARDPQNGSILMRPFNGCMMAVDPSGRGKDETGYAVVKVLNSTLFVVDCGAAPGGYDPETLQFLAETAKRHQVNHITVEPNFGDGMFTELLKPWLSKIHRCEIEEVRSKGQKELRIIDTLEPVMSNHRLVIDRSLIERDYNSVDHHSGDSQKHYRLFYQLTHVTRDKGALVRDDRLDALAMAVRYWIEAMALDADDEVEKERQRQQDETLEAFIRKATRGKSHDRGVLYEGEDTWLSS